MFPKIYINKFIFSDKVQFGFSEATASSSHLQILPLLCVIEESPSLKMYGHKLWQSPAIGSSWRAKFGSLDQTGSKTYIHSWMWHRLQKDTTVQIWCNTCVSGSSVGGTNIFLVLPQSHQKSGRRMKGWASLWWQKLPSMIFFYEIFLRTIIIITNQNHVKFLENTKLFNLLGCSNRHHKVLLAS